MTFLLGSTPARRSCSLELLDFVLHRSHVCKVVSLLCSIGLLELLDLNLICQVDLRQGALVLLCHPGQHPRTSCVGIHELFDFNLIRLRLLEVLDFKLTRRLEVRNFKLTRLCLCLQLLEAAVNKISGPNWCSKFCW